MAQKLEVLKPRDGGVAAPPRVVSDTSMSLAFKLPANFVRPKTRNAVVQQTPPATRKKEYDEQLIASWLTASNKENAGDVANGSVGEGDSGDECSWEDRDFNTQFATSTVSSTAVTPEHAENEDEDDDEDLENASSAMASLEIGGWEEQDVPDLPDDFPLLLVNLTRLQRDHFPPERDQLQQPTEEEMKQVFALVKETLHRHFAQMVEVLFEQKSCFHCTYGTSRGMLNNLHAAYPEDAFALIDYPTVIQGIELSEYLFVLSRPSRWKSIEYLKDCLRRCSRDIKWKLDVATELEVLAEQEYGIHATEQERLGAEIDELTRLRDSFKAKLEKMSAKGESKAANGQYLLLRKLEDIENRLVALLDAYLQEPELEEEECDGMFDGGAAADGSPTAGMNVLDMVVAMIFSRLPRDFSQQMTSEEHFQMLFDHHIHIRRLWKKDFGRLPQKSSNASAYSGGGDDADDDGEEEEHPRPAVYESGEDGAHFEEDRQRQQQQYYGDFESIDAEADVGGSHGSEDWETVYSEREETRGDGANDSGDDADEEDAISDDGYGGDYDSDESEDDLPATPAATPKTAAESTKTDAPKPPRRARIRQTKPIGVEEKKIEETKKKKKKKAKKSKKSSKKEKEEKPAPFQPFACTGALNFLRIAKENETF